jgi:PAS domain S-box-containing protein
VIGGTVEYIAGATRNITEQKERLQELRRNERAMDEAPVGITISDPSQDDNPLIYVNDRFEEMTGYDEDETIGRNCRWLQREDTREGPVAQMREAIDANEPVTVELRNYRKDGSEFWNRVTISPVYDDQGSVVNFVGFQQDITDRKEREQELARTHDLMANMEELADAGAWEYNSGTDTLTITDGTRRLYGLDPDEDLTLEAALDAVHPDDRDRLADRFTNCLETGEPYEMDVRFTTPDGRQRWLTANGERISESDAGSVVRGYIRDSTEQQAYERDLKRYWTVFDDLPDSVDRTDMGSDLEPEYTLQPEETTQKRLEWLLDTYQPIIEVLNRASTREEAEQTVCDFLTATRAYDIAWTAKYAPDPSVLNPHVRSDPEENVNEWEFPPMEPAGEPSLPRIAAETRGVQFVTDSDPDPEYETWREHVLKHGFSGSAIVPLTYRDNTYGLIGLYTTRASPFGNREQILLQTVGDLLGRLFHDFFVEKQLYTDTISELTLRSEDPQSFFIRASENLGCTIEILDSIPTSEETLTHYMSIRDAPLDEFVDLVEDRDVASGVRPIRRREDPPGGEVELKLSRQSLVSTLITLGAVVTKDTVTDGRAEVVCEMPVGEDIDSLVARITDSFPETELVSKAEYEQTVDSIRQTTDDILADTFREELTDRQRQTLRACLHGGYFESPRRSTATEIADALSLTQTTVSQHLRKAQQKLFEGMSEQLHDW